MEKAEAFIRTAQQAHQTALDLESEGDYAAAIFYACHAFEQAGTALAFTKGRSYANTHESRARQYRNWPTSWVSGTT